MPTTKKSKPSAKPTLRQIAARKGAATRKSNAARKVSYSVGVADGLVDEYAALPPGRYSAMVSRITEKDGKIKIILGGVQEITDTPHVPQSAPSSTFNLKEAVAEARTRLEERAQNPAPFDLLSIAAATITGARQSDYGDKRQNFSQIAMIWQGILAPKIQPGQHITPEDVALCMMGVKMARLSKSPDHIDSQVDIAGYAGCFNQLQQERAEQKPMLGAIVDPRDFGLK